MSEKGTLIRPDELDELLSAYGREEMTPSGRKKLEQWASLRAQNREILELLCGEGAMKDDIAEMYRYDAVRVWEAVHRAERRRSRAGFLRKSVLYGATACAVVASIFLFSRLPEDIPSKNHLTIVYEPGSPNAVLEMSDGTTVDLTAPAGNHLAESDATEIEVDTSAGAVTFTAPRVRPDESRPAISTVRVPGGGEFSLTLSDGTRVWLNSDSWLSFPASFPERGNREVELQGEAYFEVAHDPARPFVAKTRGQMLRVTGTSFNLSAYATEKDVETTLISGSVEITAGENTATLSYGQQSRYAPEQGTMLIQRTNAESYAGWAKGMFVFFDEPLESICRKLSRWYGVDIDTSSSTLDGIRYSGMIKRRSTFNRIAELMALTDEIFFRERDGRIVVTARRQIPDNT